MTIPDGLLIADGLDTAYIGYIERHNEPRIAVYDAEKCIQVFVDRDDMSYEDAQDWFFFNVAGAYVGEQTPAYLFKDDEPISP